MKFGIVAYLKSVKAKFLVIKKKTKFYCFLFSVFCFLFSVFCFLFSVFCFMLSVFCFLFSVFCLCFAFSIFILPFNCFALQTVHNYTASPSISFHTSPYCIPLLLLHFCLHLALKLPLQVLDQLSLLSHHSLLSIYHLVYVYIYIYLR